MATQNLPDQSLFLNKNTPDGEYIVQSFLDKGCNGLVFKGKHNLVEIPVAIKIIPKANLASGDAWLTEPKRANILSNRAVVKCQSAQLWEEFDCVVLCYDLVEGVSLRKFLKNKSAEISIDTIRRLTIVLLEVLHEMNVRGIVHGDLHAGNILVKVPQEFDLIQESEFRITDFSVRTSTENFKDDFACAAKIISDALNYLDYSTLEGRDKFLFDILDNEVVKSMLDNDRTRSVASKNPREILKRLNLCDQEYAKRAQTFERGQLSTPFDYLSCEQIGQSYSVLRTLYSDRYLALSDIQANNNAVVTGPRGCGKSTVFKSLTTIIQSQMGKIEAQPFQGIYYHCRDLSFRFPEYKAPTDAQSSYRYLPIYYVSLRLVAEILDTTDRVRIECGDLAKHYDENDVCKWLYSSMRKNAPGMPGDHTFRYLKQIIWKECANLIEKDRFKEDKKRSAGFIPDADFLFQFCEVLLNSAGFLGRKPFFFFIDDYSKPHISDELQKCLNYMFMSRTEHCFFKIATESPVSFTNSDLTGKTYVEGREYELLNIGLNFLRDDDPSSKLTFLDDVFSKRLNAVQDYPAKTLAELIGDGDGISQNELARRLRADARPEFFGRETLARLCSGDIHQMIALVREMVDSTGGRAALVGREIPKISSRAQSLAIRSTAGDFINNLRGTGTIGPKLVDVIESFCNVAKSRLKHINSKNEDGTPPEQSSRIELYERPDNLPLEAQEILDALIQYSVFIPDPRGKSRRGGAVPRLVMRRLLVPYFGLTFSLRDSIKVSRKDLLKLLLDPRGYENENRISSKGDRRIDDDRSFDLFKEGE